MDYDTTKDIEFIKNPDQWPNWPVLPVKKWNDKDMSLGVVISDACPPIRVYKTSMFNIPKTVKALADLSREEFDSVEEMVDAGWRVD